MLREMKRALLLLVSISHLAACSSSSGTATPQTDAGSDSGTVADSAPGTVADYGRALDYGTMKPMAGVTITENGGTATTGADGKWSFNVPMGTPMRPKLTLGGYINVHLPEALLNADNDRLDVPMPDLSTFMLGQFAQKGYDVTKASVSVVVYALPPCTSAEGGTLSVVSPAGASVEYFNASFPTTTVSAIVAGQTPAVTVYNLPPGVDFVFQLSHPTCKQLPYPVTVGTRTYTGKVTTEAGDSNSVFVMYMQ